MPSWKNWSGSVSAHPESIRYPEDEQDILDMFDACRVANKHMRVVGSGHSFTPLVSTPQLLISLDRMQGLVNIDAAKQAVTVKAGTKIKALGELLYQNGFSQENLGDIDVQSIAGAISTGTHGTGAGLPSIAAQVIGLKLVSSDAQVRHITAADGELFDAARISLGALGVISEVTLRVLPAYTLDYTWQKMPLDAVLEGVEDLKKENRHFEFFWVPHSNATLVKRMNISTETPRPPSLIRTFNESVLENGLLWMMCALARAVPAWSQRIAKIMGALISNGHDITPAHQTFATVRRVKFQEMEYALPAEAFVDAMRELEQAISQQNIPIMFPVEARFGAGDAIWLSPAHGRETAYIAVHVCRGTAPDLQKHYFQTAEAIFRRYEGRPHWGKLHTRSAEELRQLYPRWEDFAALRARLDPENILLNSYLSQFFAPPLGS